MPPELFGMFSVSTLLFLLFGAGALATAIVMVLYPNPVRSALMLVLNLFCVAVLYLLLNAYFLAVVQIIVYAGAIMVLFLFVIMLLNLGAPDRAPDKIKWQQPVAVGVGLIVAGLFSIIIFSSVPAKPFEQPTKEALSSSEETPSATSPTAATAETSETNSVEALRRPKTELDRENLGSVTSIGKNLYDADQPWLFPFEVTSFLLLIAVVGSVVLAKRRLPGEDEVFTEAIVREEFIEAVEEAEGEQA